jgi:hypothetical protein
MTIRDEVEKLPAETDLLSVTRGVDRCLSEVFIFNGGRRSIWLRFGEARLNFREKRDSWQLAAYLSEGVCDFEHDSAFALQLQLVGLTYKGTEYHRSTFTAWVEFDDQEGFRVPKPGYNPMKHPKATTCAGIYNEKKGLYCKWNEGEKHIIVPEGMYVPPFEPKLWRMLRGKKVEIELGPALPKEEGKKK